MTIFHFISSDDNTLLDSNVTLLFEVSSLDRFLRRTFKTYEAELDRAPQLGPSDLSSPLSLIEVARLAWSCPDGTRTAHTSLKLTIVNRRYTDCSYQSEINNTVTDGTRTAHTSLKLTIVNRRYTDCSYQSEINNS